MASSEAGSEYPEGVSGWVPTTGPVADTIDTFNKGLKSAMSYSGAEDLITYRRNVEFVRTTQAGIIESSTHAFI